MHRRPMSEFTDEAERDSLSGVVDHRKAHRIISSLRGQPRAGGRVAQIAEILQLHLAGLVTFMTGSETLPTPSPAERKPPGMQPTAIVKFRSGQEERTGQ